MPCVRKEVRHGHLLGRRLLISGRDWGCEGSPGPEIPENRGFFRGNPLRFSVRCDILLILEYAGSVR